jgi:pentatricopeptide repeat protein
VQLYDRLRRLGAAGKYDDVMSVIRILIKDRRERPDVRMYTAVIHSFVNPDEGTAGKVRRVLDEMQEYGVELDAWGCHCVLEALAVHPDYLLRNEILDYMTERWWSLTDRGHNMVVAGLLRDRHFEMALEKVQEMVARRMKVEDWLWDKMMWVLLDYGEMEECYQVLLLRQNNGSGKLNPALWMQFLDRAASVHHVGSHNTISLYIQIGKGKLIGRVVRSRLPNLANPSHPQLPQTSNRHLS